MIRYPRTHEFNNGRTISFKPSTIAHEPIKFGVEFITLEQYVYNLNRYKIRHNSRLLQPYFSIAITNFMFRHHWIKHKEKKNKQRKEENGCIITKPRKFSKTKQFSKIRVGEANSSWCLLQPPWPLDWWELP